MADYTDEKCIVCGKTFKKGDDIVVCPDCGTPYHRECWNKNNKCVNTSLHSIGKSWYEEKQKERETIDSEAQILKEKQEKQGKDKIICPGCGYPNEKGKSYCINCGTKLPETPKAPQQNEDSQGFFGNIPYPGSQTYININGNNVKIDFADPYGGMDPNDDFEGAKIGNTAKFLGQSTERRTMFLILFRKFRDTSSKISTNLACLFFPDLYFAYRKVWSMFFALVTFFILTSVPSMLASILTLDVTPSLQTAGSNNLISFVFCAIFTKVTSFLQTAGSNNPAAQQIYNAILGWQDFLEPYKITISNLSFIMNVLGFGVRVLMFFFGNFIYYKYTVRKVKGLQNDYGDKVPDDVLITKGGTSIGSLLGGAAIRIALEFVAMILVVAAIILLK